MLLWITQANQNQIYLYLEYVILADQYKEQTLLGILLD